MTNEFAKRRTLDVYRGRIAVFTRRYWYTGWHWVFLAPGFVTLAEWSCPNHHIGLVPESTLDDDGLLTHIKPHSILASPYARFGALLTDDEARRLEANRVRLGRVKTITRHDGRDTLAIDCFMTPRDFDDTNFPHWDRVDIRDFRPFEQLDAETRGLPTISAS